MTGSDHECQWDEPEKKVKSEFLWTTYFGFWCSWTHAESWWVWWWAIREGWIFLAVMGEDECLFVWYGIGMLDFLLLSFRSSHWLSSCNNVSVDLRNLKLGWNSVEALQPPDFANECKKECIGSFMVMVNIFGWPNVDSSPLLEIFLLSLWQEYIVAGNRTSRFSIERTWKFGTQESTPSYVHVFGAVYECTWEKKARDEGLRRRQR